MRKNMSKERNLTANNTKLKIAKSIGCKNLKTNARGITLIALVITVIVLLILAGVSISAITGSESALEKAKQAKTANEAADELDTVKLAVVDAVAHGNDGNVTLGNLQTALNGLDGISVVDGTGTNAGKFVVTGQKGTYIISTNGQVEKNKGVTLTADKTKVTAGEVISITASLSEEAQGKDVSWSVTGSGTLSSTSNSGAQLTIASTATTGTKVTVKASVTGENPTEYEIIVTSKLTTISIDKTTLNIEQGGTVTITATVIPTTEVEDVKFELNPNMAGAYFGTAGTTVTTVAVGTDGKASATVSVDKNTEINKKATVKVYGASSGTTDSTKVKTCGLIVIKALPFGKAEDVDKYGQEVTYTSKSGYTGKWRLFYRNATNTYIIADDLTTKKYYPYSNTTGNNGNYAVKVEGETVTNPFDASTNKAKELNPTLVLEKNALFYPANNADLQTNMKALAWECDTTVWSNYVRNGAGAGEYAVCSPSIELFIASYNATAVANGKSAISCSTGTYGYNYSCPDYLFVNNSTDKVPLNNGIYLNNTSNNWWLASPNSYGQYSHVGVCVNVNHCSLRSNSLCDFCYAVRPLVRIPNSNFDITNMTTK
ncbi:MAG: hypothetical protein IKF38_05270 [Clostridia bacterium]|nr:hypothetical protein [Clostridia bacterium]